WRPGRQPSYILLTSGTLQHDNSAAPLAIPDPRWWHDGPVTDFAHQGPLRPLRQATKLQNVLYEIRGPVAARAAQLESEGHQILKLNIGNPGTFGYEAPDTIV